MVMWESRGLSSWAPASAEGAGIKTRYLTPRVALMDRDPAAASFIVLEPAPSCADESSGRLEIRLLDKTVALTKRGAVAVPA